MEMQAEDQESGHPIFRQEKRKKEGRKEGREGDGRESGKRRERGKMKGENEERRTHFSGPGQRLIQFFSRKCLSPHLDHFLYQLSYSRATTHLL